MKSKAIWIFNPFVYIAGWQALAVGVGIMLLTAMTGYFSNTHMDGVIGAGFGKSAPFWIFLTESFIAWIVLSMSLLLAGKIVSGASFRWIDLFGTQALARAPMLIAPLMGFPELNRRVTGYLLSKFFPTGQEATATQFEIIIFILIVLVMILAVIWSITLMYNAYKLVCNLRGTKAGISFAIALVLAHIAASIIFILLYRDIYLNPDALKEFTGNSS